MIEASAPGKLVLTGEYAVLAGAPALVAAIDRRVTCRLTPRRAGGWAFTSRGFEAQSAHPRELFSQAAAAPPSDPNDPAALVLHVLHHLDFELESLPEHLRVEIDSRPCFHGGNKLGVGSSAACVVAVSVALAELANTTCTLSQLLAAHRDLQGGSGSGLDVAASHQGGVIRFQNGNADAASIPDDVHYVIVYAGSSVETGSLVQRFNAWRLPMADAGGHSRAPDELRRLVDLANVVADPANDFLEALAGYIEALVALDEAARIGIFSAEHLHLSALAGGLGVLYKPCGAGGGDVGVAMARDVASLAAFESGVTQEGFIVIPAEITTDGVQVRRG